MKVKNNVEILDITHSDLVNLFSTALYGSSYLSVEYNKEFYNSLPASKKEGDCLEDAIADVLLNGGEVYLYDGYAEGEVYSDSGKVIKEEYGDDEYVQYTITLADVIEGLQKAASGTYKANDDNEFAKQSFDRFAEDECMDFDIVNADALMQIIMFNEIIYG